MARNDRRFLEETVSWLAASGVRAWVAGGWAEELLGLRPPGPHGDVDLLCREESLAALERLLVREDVVEVPEKRLSHKRALERGGVLVELFLSRREGARWVTSFFGGGYTHRWPADTFSHPPVGGIPVASPAALASYRARHGDVSRARETAEMGSQRPRTCPGCGSDRIRRILYGLPTAEALEEARDGRHILGGCVLSGDDPEWGCLDCNWPLCGDGGVH